MMEVNSRGRVKNLVDKLNSKSSNYEAHLSTIDTMGPNTCTDGKHYYAADQPSRKNQQIITCFNAEAMQLSENELTSKLNMEEQLTAELRQLRENESKLLAEIQEMREQNELLEFCVLELEYCNNNSSKQKGRLNLDDKETDDVSDSGVMSLSPCEKFYWESEFLDNEEPRVSGNEVQHKLECISRSTEDSYIKIVVQQAIDLLKHYEMRITGMETTLTNVCQERKSQNLEEYLPLEKSDTNAKLKNHRAVATVSPFVDASLSQSCLTNSSFEKLFCDSDRFQESGIFDEFLESEIVEKKSIETQTNSQITLKGRRNGGYRINDRNENNGGGVDDHNDCNSNLADELNKLEKIKRRIEEQGPLLNPYSETNSRDCAPKVLLVTPCYDSWHKWPEIADGNERTIQKIGNPWQKERELQIRLDYLTNKISKMEMEMKRLDEEKCEYEEAENDSRLKCQKLELKLHALAEKKNDLQFQLQQHLRTLTTQRNMIKEFENKEIEANKKINELEIVINNLQELNFQLEEEKLDLTNKYQFLETTYPALLLWNIYAWFTNFKKQISVANQSLVPKHCDDYHLREENYKLKARVSTLEKGLIEKEHTISRLQSVIGEHQQSYRNPTRQMNNSRAQKVEQKWTELVACSRSPRLSTSAPEEIHLRTLEQIDEIIVGIERNFKKKLDELTYILNDKQMKLDECERKLSSLSMMRPMQDHLIEKIQNLEADIFTLKQVLRTRDGEKQKLIIKEKCLLEEIDQLNDTLIRTQASESELKNKFQDEKNSNKELEKELAFKAQQVSDIETNYDDKLKNAERTIISLTRELENHNVTNSELKEEVDTLEDTICELNLQLNQEKNDKEKVLVKYKHALALKQQEIDSLRRLSSDSTALNAAQEMGLEYKYDDMKISPKIMAITEESINENQGNVERRVTNSIKKLLNSNESSAHMIRQIGRYTLTRPSIREHYKNFEKL